jgi:anaerobic magnesium-protoporphyrin IX monomethyl ester cyclase
MRILFVVKSKVMETLGVMYLASVVKQAGHEAKIVDIGNALSVRFEWKPEIIGMSIMTGDMEKFRGLAMQLRYGNTPHPTIIVGGPDPCFFPQGYEWADHVVKGEGENWLSEFLGSDARYPNLDSMPWPERSDFSNMKIRDFISSRGCPYSCSYCYNDSWAKMFPELPRVRTRSVKDVIKEINFVSPEFVYFQDSCFGVSMKWMQEFSRMYRAEINIPFHCHLRPNQVNEERVTLLSDAGCMSVRIALESASTKLRNVLGRGKMDLNQVRQACRLLSKWGIKLMIQNILGVPTSTIEDDLETLEFNIKCRPSYGWCSIFVPYPGTKLGDQCVKEGWFKGNYSEISDCFFDESVLEFSQEYKEQVECLQKVFALCVEVGYLPEARELTYRNFPKLVHKILRQQGDTRLYGGVI